MNDNVSTVIGILAIILIWILGLKVIDWLFASKQPKVKEKKEDKKETTSGELLQCLFFSPKESAAIYSSILDFIDSFIDNALDNYFKLEAPEADHYISQEEVAKISKYILASVSKNMTPEVLHVLKLVYNVKTDEDLTKFLKLRIKLRMIDVIVNVNKPIE